MFPFLHAINMYLLRAYYVLGVRDTVETMVGPIPTLLELWSW